MWEELCLFYTKGVYIPCSVQCTSLVHWSHCYWIFFFFPTSANCKQTSQTVLIKMWCRSSSRNPLACTLCHSGNLTRMFHYHSECTHRTSFCFFAFVAHIYSQNIKYFIQGHCSLEHSRCKWVLEFKVASTLSHQWKQKSTIEAEVEESKLSLFTTFPSCSVAPTASTNGDHSSRKTNWECFYFFFPCRLTAMSAFGLGFRSAGEKFCTQLSTLMQICDVCS